MKRLVTATSARQLGFPSVAKKAISTHKTGYKQCPTVAEVIYQNTKALSGLIDEVFSCSSVTAAEKYTSDLAQLYPKDATVTPPAALGTSAVYGTNPPLFAFFWTHGTFGALVVVDTAASSNDHIALLHKNDPLTPALSAALTKAALEQNKRLR
ncbi:MAG TPA: hypothetical protein VHW93_06095 [Acidimicrobiales bacterium]|nr:hypothetical protein [Acidimicrobiales bacterium]